MALASLSLNRPGSRPQLTEVLVFFVGRGIARFAGLAALGSVSLPCALGPGAIDMVLTRRNGVGSAA